MGAESSAGHPVRYPDTLTESRGRFTVAGTGDIAPAVRLTLSGSGTIDVILTGTFAALIAVIVVGTRFITAEYRDDMIRVTLAARRRISSLASAPRLAAPAIRPRTPASRS